MDNNDLNIIQQIETALDIKLDKLDKIEWNSKGYILNEYEQVTGLGLYQCGIEELTGIIFLLSDFNHLALLNLTDNRIRNLSPLNQLRHLTTLYLSYNQIGDLSPLLVKLRKSIHWT